MEEIWLWSQSEKIPHALEQLSLCTATLEPVFWSPGVATAEARTPRVCVPQQEEPWQWKACPLQLGSNPRSPQPERSPHTATKTQHSQKANK